MKVRRAIILISPAGKPDPRMGHAVPDRQGRRFRAPGIRISFPHHEETMKIRVKPLWTFLRASLGFATDLFAVLLACRLSTILTILGFVFFVLVGQGREFVEALASETEDPRYWAHQLFFLAAVLIWLWTTWLTSVALLANQPARAVSDSLRLRKIERFMPRALAFLAVLSVATGSIVMAQYVQGAAYLLLAPGLLAVAWRYEDALREALAQKSRVAVPAKLDRKSVV